MKKWFLAVITGALVAAAPAWSEEGPHRIGVGAHYWKYLDEIDEDFDEDGIAWIATYQYRSGLVGVGVDVGWWEVGFPGAEQDLYDPQVYLIVGGGLYAAAGVGIYYFESEFADDPFYFFRAGFDLELLPSLHLDIYGAYRFDKLDDLSEETTDIDTDTISLGAAVRFAF